MEVVPKCVQTRLVHFSVKFVMLVMNQTYLVRIVLVSSTYSDGRWSC